MGHPAFSSGSVAVITGGASGIGLATALKCAKIGMRIVIVDINQDALDHGKAQLLEAGAAQVIASATDVSDRGRLEALERKVSDQFGPVHVLMNNAGIEPPSTCLGDADIWHQLLGVNFYGVLNGCQVFGPGMMAHSQPAAIINTGSKQGITSPPGNPAYNVSKAALKTYTEALSHELRNTEDCKVSVHLLVPGFVYTGLTNRPTKPDGAWTAEQTATFFLERISDGDFYIICPDNDITREIDEKRMAWAIGDIIHNRPALSRWHPDYADAFETFLRTIP